jgi:hypothetical protein
MIFGNENTDTDSFLIFGVIEEAESSRPLSNLIVRAFDRDIVFDDKLGFTNTDADGRFEIRYYTEQFRDLWEARPDIYLRIYDSSGTRLLHETTHEIRWNASRNEYYRLCIPAAALATKHAQH